MDVIISVAAKIAEFTISPIGRQFGYILYYKGNLKRMGNDFQKLEGEKNSVQHKVDEARRNGEEIEIIVQNWLNEADKIYAKAKKLIDTEGHAKAHCSMGHFPNLFKRRQLSRKTKNMSQKISKLLADKQFDTISYHVRSQMTVTPFGRGYEALDSRTSMLNDIMLELKNPNIFIIGVYGMGGVGKTTLVKELAWQVEYDGSFNAVVMATITNSPDLEKIQGQIADALDLKFNMETKEGRAMQLRRRIRNEKSILVILDDIWGKLDLTEVGIPFGDDHKGCKLVVTSRDRNVLNSEMAIQKEFRLEVLLDEDNWKLFEKLAGDVVHDFNIKPIAVQVAMRCAGLPLLIVTVAKALRKKNISDWKDALNDLERFDQEGLHKRVYSTLELTYNCLESDELKLLFLFIGSFGLDYIYTGRLFSHYWGSGLCRHSHTLTDARNRYYKLINDLKASSLLLESEEDKLITIHDTVRDVAKSIASRTRPTYGVKRHSLIKEWPEIDQLQKCHQIILPWSYIHKLPEKMECPELKLLILGNLGDYLKVHDDFFSGMRELKVIDLHGMIFTPSPPSSLSLLTKLKTLNLSGCVFEDLSIVAELKTLEILQLERSHIKELPKEIGQLTNLRILNLTNCTGLRFIPANVISSLTCLEELYMGNCFIQWDIKGSKSNNASLEELRDLSQLTNLDIMIQDASVWPRDLKVFEKLKRYNIFVGDKWKWSLDWAGNASKSSRILKLKYSRSSSILLDCRFNFLLNSAEDMTLAKIHVRNVLYELNMEGFPQLKHFCIQDSTDLKYIVNSMGWVHPYPAFPNLETLALQNLFNLEEICHGPIPIQCFTKLKSFEVKGCDKLKNLFWHSLIRNLCHLLEIKISDCKMITEIISEQTSEAGNEIDTIMFPKLRSIELEHLPSLISFCSVPLAADNTQCIPVALIDQKVGMPHLELLKLSKINSRKLWDDKLPGLSFMQNLRSLTVDRCGNIAYVFSFSVAREFVNLKHLAISNCQMLEEIFVSDGKLGSLPLSQNQFSNNEVIFPNLETLVISHMVHLKLVWYNQLARNSFGKLKELKIEFCNEISNLIPSYVLNRLQNLEKLTVANCPTLETVFETQGLKADGRHTRLEMQLKSLTLKHLLKLKHIWNGNPNESFKFQNLCLLHVTECKSLNHIIPLSVAKEIQHLQELYIEECGIEIIVGHDEMADRVPIFIFPELTSLSLRGLTQLRSFYRGLHTLDFPVLKHVDVLHCDKLALFKPKSLNCQDNVPVDTLPLLSIEKVVPKTSELILNSKDVSMLCNGQLNDELIHTVTALRLRCFHDEFDKFPSGFLQRFVNLKNLKVTCSSFTYVLSGSECAGHSETIMNLNSLVLVKLDNLDCIYEENSEVQPILQNIETLSVHRCSKLKNVIPSSVMFENLEQLVVDNCAGLENILRSSTATSLQKLRKLFIDGCEKIEEIVASDDANDASELAFMKLEYLRLSNLPRLRSFCKGKHGFKFPLLKTLYVVDCPVMETFSHGMLDAPKLTKVQVTLQHEFEWNGDLNTTIKKMSSVNEL